MTTPTPMSPPGIALLGSVREIFELAGVINQLDSGDLRPKLLDISPHEKYIVDENNKNEDKVVGIVNNEAMVEDTEDEESESDGEGEDKTKAKTKVEKNPPIKKKRRKSVPILASKGEPEFEIGIKKALSLKMFPVVIVGGGGSHAMCAYQYDDQTQQEMLYIQSHSMTYTV